MATINLPFAAGADRRAPTSTELDQGYGCGDADLRLFDWLAHWITGHLANVISKSNLSVDDTDIQRMAKAVRSQRMNYIATPGGTANALTVTLDPAPASYADLVGTPLRVRFGAANTGAMTINVNGLGAVALNRGDNTALPAGYIIAGEVATIVYDGTTFRLPNVVRRTTDSVAGAFSVGGEFTVGLGATFNGNIAMLGGGFISLGASAAGGFINSTGTTTVAGIPFKVFLSSSTAIALGLNNTGSATQPLQNWSTDTTVRQEVPANGGFHVLPGTSNGSSFLSNRNAGSFNHFNAITGGSTVFSVDNAGQIYSTSTSITPISDRNLKKDVADFGYGLETVLAIKPVTYRLNGEDDGAPKKSGFIAQEIEELIPESVRDMEIQTSVDEAGEPVLSTVKVLSMDVFIPLLVKAMQEQAATIDDLRGRIAALEA